MAPVAAAQKGDIPRTPSGRPDLSGTYDVSTLTPMQRASDLGEKMFLTDEEAAEIAAADPMHTSGMREYILERWHMNEGTLTIKISYSDGSREVL